MASALLLTTLVLSSATRATRAESMQKTIDFQSCPEFNSKIEGITGVQGVPFECATLSVPLDYTNTDSESLELDLFRVKATEEPVLGSVLINFGGPGGTGAENLPAWATEAHANIGGQWNLVSWDPRGTGTTIPFRCSLGAAAGVTAGTQKRETGTLVSANTTKVFENGGWQAAGQIVDSCYAQVDKTNATLIGTAFVARDMIEIVDGLGEDGLLRYYGWSYGTALGSYVAALFPDRVERMVLDGNINPYDYQSGDYGDFAIDIDEAFAGFLQTCYAATNDCALYTLLQPKSAEDILTAINLAFQPYTRNATATGGQAYSLLLAIKSQLVMPLYFPDHWPTFAKTLADLLNGTTPVPAPAVGTYGTAEQALIGIRSSDSTFIANSSSEYLSQVQYQATVSPGFSDIAYFPLWISAQWKLQARERYWGNFNITTKTPLLYVNGEYDPATPLVNAYNASAGFNGSVVLPHSGYGHGVFASPSQCVARYVKAYFADGTLPDEGTHCEPDQSTLEVWKGVVKAAEAAGNSTSPGASGNTTSSGGPPEATGGASRGQASIALVVGALLAVVAVEPLLV